MRNRSPDRQKRPALPDRELPGWLSGVLVLGAGLAVLYFETRRPLRKTRQSKVRRNSRNLCLAMTTAATVRLAETPLTSFLMREGKRRNAGLLRRMRMPVWLELPLSVVLLDYTLFVWHYLTHRVPLLWRLHRSHHVDLDMDASTALRFHPVEILLSIPWRGAQVFLLGISPLELTLWQTLTLMGILFHHANLRLPIGLERKLVRFVVTPRMHGIHHSIVREETHSNWSTIFSWPDCVHGTLRLHIPQDRITIGVPAFRDPEALTLGKILKMPVTAKSASWRLAGEGPPRRSEEDLPDRKDMLMP